MPKISDRPTASRTSTEPSARPVKICSAHSCNGMSKTAKIGSPTLEHFPAKCESVRRRMRKRKEARACSDSNGTEHALALSLAEESPPRPILTGAAEYLQD